MSPLLYLPIMLAGALASPSVGATNANAAPSGATPTLSAEQPTEQSAASDAAGSRGVQTHAPTNASCSTKAPAAECPSTGAPPLPSPGYDVLSHDIPCDGVSDMYPRLATLIGSTVPRAGGGTISFNAPGKTCVLDNRKTIVGNSSISYSVTTGTNIEYRGSGVLLPLRRTDIIRMHPAIVNAKYSNSASNDVTTFSYMFADSNPADKTNREKMATYALCDTSDTSLPPGWTHDCVGAQLDSDNPFGARFTRQWGLTANAIQSLAKGDGQMTGGEFDITLVSGNTAQPKVDQPNSKYGQQVVCISAGPNCTTGTYYTKTHDGIGKWNNAITINASAVAQNALCLLEVNSTEKCQTRIDNQGGVHAMSVQLQASTYDALPVCGPDVAGMVAYIADARVAPEKWHQPVTVGGGTNKTLVQCLGAGWLAM